jgi:hypothetical protein
MRFIAFKPLVFTYENYTQRKTTKWRIQIMLLKYKETKKVLLNHWHKVITNGDLKKYI